MTLKIPNLNLPKPGDKADITRINDNFCEISSKIALNPQEIEVKIPVSRWTTGTKYNPDGTTVPEPDGVAARTLISIDVPQDMGMVPTYLICGPAVADSAENITMLDHMAACGVDLVWHSPLPIVGSNLQLCFRARMIRPRKELVYTVVLI